MYTYSLSVNPVWAVINGSVVNWWPLVTHANTTNQFSVVVNPLTLPTVTMPAVGAGQIGFSVNGQVGPDYAVQVSSNLVDWTTLQILNPTTMPFNWNTNTGVLSQQYYRIKVGPPLP